jgi:hypothetical protein
LEIHESGCAISRDSLLALINVVILDPGHAYELVLGSTGVGSSNVANTGWRTATSREFNGMPNNGETLYARLTTNFNGTKVSRDYVYTAYTAP